MAFYIDFCSAKLLNWRDVGNYKYMLYVEEYTGSLWNSGRLTQWEELAVLLLLLFNFFWEFMCIPYIVIVPILGMDHMASIAAWQYSSFSALQLMVL